jgi:dCMP deaminase
MRSIESTKWDKRFMQVAELVSSWSSCIRDKRQIGAVIVKNKRIITTGYNGASSGIESCFDKGSCIRNENDINSGQRHELCYATHAEQNAIIQAARIGVSIEGATLYCTHQPCAICAKMIINAGIVRIVFQNGYPDEFAMKLLIEAGIEIVNYSE